MGHFVVQDQELYFGILKNQWCKLERFYGAFFAIFMETDWNKQMAFSKVQNLLILDIKKNYNILHYLNWSLTVRIMEQI